MLNNTTTSLSDNKILQNLAALLAITLSVALFVFIISYIGIFRFAPRAEVITPGNATTVQVEGFEFMQPELRVKAGTEVNLELVNGDILPHSFDVDELNLHIEMPGNETALAAFTTVEPGRYTFYCGVPGHREARMVGTLVIEP